MIRLVDVSDKICPETIHDMGVKREI